MAKEIAGIIEEAGIKTAIYPDAEPNPTDKNVHNGIDVFNKEKFDLIVSLVGGSSLHCAKGIGIVAGNGGNICDYECVDKSTKPVITLIAVKTTTGTASEIARFCIITDTDRYIKMAIVDWLCFSWFVKQLSTTSCRKTLEN